MAEKETKRRETMMRRNFRKHYFPEVLSNMLETVEWAKAQKQVESGSSLNKLTELAKLVEKLQRELRGVKFALAGEQSSITGDHYYSSLRNMIVVYREDDIYILGGVMFDKLQDSTDNYLYGVWSPFIENAKYSQDYWKSMLLVSSSMDRIVKHAKTYLTSMSLSHMYQIHAAEIKEQERLPKKDFTRRLIGGCEELFGNGIFWNRDQWKAKENWIVQTLWQLANSPQAKAFLPDDRINKLLALQDLQSEFFKLQEYQPEHLPIHVMWHKGRERQMFRYVEHADEYKEFPVISTFCQNELPYNATDKLSALSLVDVGEYVTGVGYRKYENLFYITKEDFDHA
jgi:hypothetical protein